MKKVNGLYYNAASGVYYEKRLPKSRQFLVLCYIAVIGLGVALVGSGYRPHLGHTSIVAKTHTATRLVATKTIKSKPIIQPVAPVLHGEADRLTSAVNTVIGNSQAAGWSVSMYDLKSQSKLVRINDQQQFEAGNLSKLFTAYALAETTPFAQWESTPINGSNLQDCVDLMLRTNNYTCGSAINQMIGLKTIDSYVHAAGFTGTSFYLRSGVPETSTVDVNRFMTALQEYKLLDKPTTDFLLASLQHQTLRTGIPAGCPNCTVDNIMTDSSTVTHDTAVVVSGDRTYALTIMSNAGGTAKIAAIAQAIQAVLTAPSKP